MSYYDHGMDVVKKNLNKDDILKLRHSEIHTLERNTIVSHV